MLHEGSIEKNRVKTTLYITAIVMCVLVYISHATWLSTLKNNEFQGQLRDEEKRFKVHENK